MHSAVSVCVFRLVFVASLLGTGVAYAQDQPNILIIWGDDIGSFNISAYNMGMMGYKTPNIDRIAREGIIFTDSYGDQSCTAGRSSFITGQVLRVDGGILSHAPPFADIRRMAAGRRPEEIA